MPEPGTRLPSRPRGATVLIPLLLAAAGLGGAVLRARPVRQEPAGTDALDALDTVAALAEGGESAERYAQVKVVEGSVLLRTGETDQTLTRGLPVAEGDVVDSRGRGVLQLGDGSAVAFGAGTRFRVAALFAERDQARRVLLVLEHGELRLCRGALSDALLRVDTPSGTGTLGQPGTAGSRPDVTFQVAGGGRTTFLVHGGQAAFRNTAGSTPVFAGQRLTVYGAKDTLDRLAEASAFDLDAFDTWAGDLVKPAPGDSASRVPDGIRYYASDLDTGGRWVYVDDCSSWCWTPAVAEDWRPYCDGRWAPCEGGLTWVGAEPWAFLTCHFGRWGWGPDLGWYWIPGVTYSPAWVAWNCSGPYLGWAPLGFGNRPCQWGYGPWAGGYAWNIVNFNYVNNYGLRNRICADPAVLHAFQTAGTSPRTWTSGRMMVTGAEFRDPARFQQVATQPALSRERMTAYAGAAQAATGRTLLPSGPERQGVSRTPDRPVLQEPFHAQAPFQGPTLERPRERSPRPVQEGQAQRARPREGVPANVPPATEGPAAPPARDERERPAARTADEERPRETGKAATAGGQRPAHPDPAQPARPPRTEARREAREQPKAPPHEGAKEPR